MPERIGRYEILLPIASGGMATVYLARSRGAGGFERDVALKLTHPHLRETQEFASHLLEEAKLAVRIRHPNVVSILDVEDDPAGLFLVMDYVHGDTLAGLRRKAALPPRVGVKILLDALAGLHAAHELRDDDGQPLGIVHRDFSPQNILVGMDGNARLTDFGIAKAATRLSNTSTGLVKGKAAYMSPEQARSQKIDRRCDVWAAGIIAWELFAERRLYDADDLATLLKVVSEPPPRLRTLVPRLPQEIDDTVARALAMDIGQRTPTAAAFARALTAACYPHGYVAETEEVAAFVEQVAGKKLAERRARARDIAERRARGEKNVVAVDTSGGTPSARRAPVVTQAAFDPTMVDDKPPVAAPPSLGKVPLLADGVLRPPAPTLEPTVPFARPLPAGPVHDPRSGEPSSPELVSGVEPALETRTDTNAIATHSVADFLARPRVPAKPFVIGGAAVVAVLGLVLIAAGVRSGSRETATSGPTSAQVATSAADTAISAAASRPERTRPDPSPPSNDTGTTSTAATLELPSVAVHANATIKEIRVDQRSVEVPPGRDVRVDLFPDEHARSTKITATSSDGRQASATLSAGARTLTLEFPRTTTSPPAAARPTPTAAPPARPPLATNPYVKQ